ncbi:unnamed protein product, partial [Closterium sp. NIES-54]
PTALCPYAPSPPPTSCDPCHAISPHAPFIPHIGPLISPHLPHSVPPLISPHNPHHLTTQPCVPITQPCVPITQPCVPITHGLAHGRKTPLLNRSLPVTPLISHMPLSSPTSECPHRAWACRWTPAAPSPRALSAGGPLSSAPLPPRPRCRDWIRGEGMVGDGWDGMEGCDMRRGACQPVVLRHLHHSLLARTAQAGGLERGGEGLGGVGRGGNARGVQGKETFSTGPVSRWSSVICTTPSSLALPRLDGWGGVGRGGDAREEGRSEMRRGTCQPVVLSHLHHALLTRTS